MHKCGRVKLLLGPMFGGKTSRLLSEIERERYAGGRAMIIKYAADIRYAAGDSVVTHRGMRAVDESGTEDMGPLTVTSAHLLATVVLPDGVAAIGIDEGQFYGDLEVKVAEWAARGINVVVAALNGDYSRAPFPRVSAVLGLATSIDFFPAVCRCGSDAHYSMKIVSDVPVGGELIGGADKFRAMCPACYRLNTSG